MSIDVTTPPTLTKPAAERANWRLAHTWADNLSLEYAGVDLADCVTYNVLSVLGGIALQHLEQGASADGQQSSA